MPSSILTNLLTRNRNNPLKARVRGTNISVRSKPSADPGSRRKSVCQDQLKALRGHKADSIYRT